MNKSMKYNTISLIHVVIIITNDNRLVILNALIPLQNHLTSQFTHAHEVARDEKLHSNIKYEHFSATIPC